MIRTICINAALAALSVISATPYAGQDPAKLTDPSMAAADAALAAILAAEDPYGYVSRKADVAIWEEQGKREDERWLHLVFTPELHVYVDLRRVTASKAGEVVELWSKHVNAIGETTLGQDRIYCSSMTSQVGTLALLDERGDATVKNDRFLPASPILPGSIMEAKASWACN
ncbi:hypothetical protein LJR168_003922 [Pseudoxanthomonas sp. LjRoot168]|uniref:hypothetical protein n=1 Tax=unclassified Pseudoxanthomonas TaxID=2645906 RepID=UPI003ED0A3C5